MKAVTRIYFFDRDGEKFFGEGPAMLLRSIEETGSLRAAAISMEMAYTKALKLVKQTEKALGFPVLHRTTGGKAGGGSLLTAQGRQWLAQYEAYRDACVQNNQRLFRRFFPTTGCVIMASGMGTRFGGNKLMADFQGKPLFLRAVNATEGLFDKRVVVTRHEEVARVCEHLDLPVVLHNLPHRSDTVRLGLDALGDMDCCMFLPGDQPLLKRDTTAALLNAWKQSAEQIVRPVSGGICGSPVIFPQWAFPELRCLPEGKGGGVVIRNHPDSLLAVPIDDPIELADADTPEALEALREEALRRRME